MDVSNSNPDGASELEAQSSAARPDGAAATGPSDVADAMANDAAGSPDDASGAIDAGAAQYDLGHEFSFSQNPNGPWRYGYTKGTTLALDQVVLDRYGIAQDGGIGIWHPSDAGGDFSPVANPSDGGAGYYPYVADNPGTTTYVYAASWAVRAGEVAMEASNGGQYSVVQFVAPEGGTYDVQAHFEGVHFRLSTTDVHVRVNDVEVFSSEIDGYGGDPAAFQVQGANPAADYRGMLSLLTKDIVTFAVGWGTDGSNFNDTTGLLVHVVRTNGGASHE
jgi:hypothetical protein